MIELSPEKKAEIVDLVFKQKKAKLNWVMTVAQVSEEELLANLSNLGLYIEDEFIMIKSETKEQKAQKTIASKREQIITAIINRRFFSHNPEATAQVTFNQIKKNTLISHHTALTTEWLVDRLGKTKYVIHTFEGDFIETDDSNARKILEQMKEHIKKMPDETIRLHIPIKKYFSFMVLPLIKENLESDVQAMLLNLAEQEDAKIASLAYNYIEQNILDTELRGNFIKALKMQLPNGQRITVKANQIQQLFKQLQQEYEMDLRGQFYNKKNFLTNFLS